MTNLKSIDQRILQVLQLDGRISNAALADLVGLSPSACLRRVQQLEQRGVILGYRAMVDSKATGGGVTVMVGVGLARHLKQDQEAFERAMTAAPEVRECHNVSGTIEYMLRVEVKDLESYKAFHTDVLGIVPQVASITSYFVMSSPKDLRG